MYVSTLHDFVKALGGELKITAKFPEGTVEITQFEGWGLSLACFDFAASDSQRRDRAHSLTK